MQEVREKLRVLMNWLKNIQDGFSDLFGVEDIYSNSKTFEILIAVPKCLEPKFLSRC